MRTAVAPSFPRLFLLSEPDPVARGIGELWGTGASTGAHVDGVPIRRLEDGVLYVRRPGPHLHDERVDLRLPPALRELRPTLVFPSVHRSESDTPCLTVHPLGNAGPRADLGGRPRTVAPTDPRGMTAVLRALAEDAPGSGVPATFEATHHGPEVGLPAFFAEVAVVKDAAPAPEQVRRLAAAIRTAAPDPRDRVALAVGGGHYAPRFTDLARSRRWAFGHILSRHALAGLEPATARSALRATPGSEGILYARASDRGHPAFAGLAPELREQDAPVRDRGPLRPTGTSLPTSGT